MDSWVQKLWRFGPAGPELPQGARRRLGTLAGHVNRRTDGPAALSSCGRQVAAGLGRRLWVFDRGTGQPGRCLWLDRSVEALAFVEPDAAVLLGWGEEGGVAVWHRGDDVVEPIAALGEHLEQLAVSADGSTLAVASSRSRKLWVLDRTTGDPRRQLRRPEGSLVSVALSADGGVVATRTETWEQWGQFDRGPTETVVHIVEVASGRERTWRPSGSHRRGLAIVGDRVHVGVGARSVVYDLASSAQIAAEAPPAAAPPTLETLLSSAVVPGNIVDRCLAIGPNGQHAATADRLWNLATGAEAALPGVAKTVEQVGFGADGSTLLRVRDGSLEAVGVEPPHVPVELPSPGFPVAAVGLAPNGRCHVAAEEVDRHASSSRVRVVSASGPDREISYPGQVWRMSFSSNSRFLLIRGRNNTPPAAHDLREGTSVLLPGIRDPGEVWLSPDGAWLAYERGGTFRLHLRPVGRKGRPKDVDTEGWNCDDVAFSPDGRVMAVACADGVIRLYETGNVRPYARLEGHLGRTTCVRFAPDSESLVSTAQDGTAIHWDVVLPA